MRYWIAIVGLLLLVGPSFGQQKFSQQSKMKVHRVVIQVDQDDPKAMNLALNNASNMKEFWEGKGERVEIELVAFGPGLHMLREDTSPVKDRIAALATKGIRFSACGNTMANQSKAEEKPVTLIPQAHQVATGVVRITELEEQGWTYLRP
jgi:intracellular sulfur oxidation DsrE/DsrF family protein